VWVVDDSRLQGDLCRDALAPSYLVEVFESGAAMLEALALGQLPQLLVLDWHMPDMSGVEVCRFVRETLDAGRLPILILTGATSEESLLEALSAGANDFVRKPFLTSELNARVAALMRSAALYSELLQTENQLRVEVDFRERFMGLLAHDLRQPLNTIFMANSTLASLLDDARLTKTMQMQIRAAKRMKGMIAELLDFTRVRPETGMPIHRVPTDLEVTAHSVLEEVRATHPERPFEFQALGNCIGNWDPDRLAQVCSNLLGNAIEHGDANAPVVARVDGSDEKFVALVVLNVGRPIAAELLQHLFLPFRRAGGGPGGGVGLGLYIVEQIAAAHGGSVTAESDAESTRFVVRLPR
jgi:signal transduction histidine kinase